VFSVRVDDIGQSNIALSSFSWFATFRDSTPTLTLDLMIISFLPQQVSSDSRLSD
jgi:hypothetical protein